jgi:hypothetical protein
MSILLSKHMANSRFGPKVLKPSFVIGPPDHISSLDFAIKIAIFANTEYTDINIKN